MPNDPQVPWTDEQWARVNQVIQEEAGRARVAATFLPLYGPLPADTDFVRREEISYEPSEEGEGEKLRMVDKTTIQLSTLEVKVEVRGAQMADPEMRSVLALFRRAAYVVARLEDAMVFNGQPAAEEGPPQGAPPRIWKVCGGEYWRGLKDDANEKIPTPVHDGYSLVEAVSSAIGHLEGTGHFGPFAVVLDQDFFLFAQTPHEDSLVLPQDRIIPFLGGGWLLRSSTLPEKSGVVVALGGAPVELVVAKDVSLQFLQVTEEPKFLFRVFEKMVLRIKEPEAIVTLLGEPPENGGELKKAEGPKNGGDLKKPDERKDARRRTRRGAEAGGGSSSRRRATRQSSPPH